MTAATLATEIRTAHRADAGRALALLTRAFESDPLARWAFPDDRSYRTYFPQFARGLGGRAFDVDTADCAAELSGIALWLPPGADSNETLLMGALEGGAEQGRLPALDSLMSQMAKAHPRERHWYLPLIGVDPVCQGEGIGSALLRHAIDRIDESDCPLAYLEASDPATVGFYRRVGFEPVGEIQAGDSPVMVPMVRGRRGRSEYSARAAQQKTKAAAAEYSGCPRVAAL
jgi:ribosomal protein S18 acetylase RimI-like enzyme